MPSLLQKLHHKHHSAASSSSASSNPTSPKLETLSLSSSASPPSTTVVSSSNNPDSNGRGTATGLKSILRTSTMSSDGSSVVSELARDSQLLSGASTPRTSLVGSSSVSSSQVQRTPSVDIDMGEETLGCKGLEGQFSCTYAIVAFSRTNVLQFINLPKSLHVPVLESIRASWHKGVSSHGTPKVGGGKLGGGTTIVDVWEVHLNGLAWGARGTRAGVAVRRLISQLLSTLAQNGFALAASIDASFKDSSKDTLYLRRMSHTPIPTQFFSMAFIDEDRIWLIDCPSAVIESVEEAVGYAWPQGVQKSGPLSKEPGCWEIRIKGSPWSGHGHASQISSRLLHLHLLRAVYVQGFQLKGSISLSDKDEGEMDSLFFESRIEGDD